LLMRNEPKQPVRLTLQAKIILFLWKWLGVWVALAGFVWGYAGFIWLTKERLSDPYLRSRMFIFAKLVDATTSPRAPKDFAEILNKVLNDTSWTNSQVKMPEGGLRFILADASEKLNIAEQLSTMSSNKPPSYEFTGAVKKLRMQLTRIVEPQQQYRIPLHDGYRKLWFGIKLPKNIIWRNLWPRLKQRLTKNDLRLRGVDFREPEQNMASVQQEAADFLAHRDLFHGSAKQTPSEIKLRPWKIIRFYDVRRVNLNETIPLAFATLLLACGFFLDMRFSDYSRKWKWLDDASLQYQEQFEDVAQESQNGKWVAFWEESRNSGPTVVSLFRQKRAFWGLLIFLTGLALLLEFFLQNPQQRQEWIINTPIMVGCAFALTLLFLTLFDLGRLNINPQLSGFSPGFRKRLFRPLLMGTASLFAVSVWGIFYSVVELAALSGTQTLRAIVQVALCGCALWLLARLLGGIEDQLSKLRAADTKPVPKEVEENLNKPRSLSLLNNVFPDMDERLVKAAALGLVPILSIVQSFL